MGPVIYIPSFNGRDQLTALLASLRVQTRPCQIVVVENGSIDGTSETISQDFPEVRLIAMGTNLGFGPALNRAIAEEPADPIILLNQDVICPPDFVEALLERSGAGAEMVAAVLVSQSDPGRIDSAGVVADRTLMGFDYLHGEPVEAAVGAPDPLGPTGGAALYSAAPFKAVGGFDERIFLYYEDLDLALRLRGAGGRCRLAPEARAAHAYSQSLGAASPEKYFRTGWSRGYMLGRYGVLRRPRDAARVLAAEGAICLGQIVADRTIAGVRGRLAGVRAAKGLPSREVPTGLADYSLGEAIAMRRRRRGPLTPGVGA